MRFRQIVVAVVHVIVTGGSIPSGGGNVNAGITEETEGTGRALTLTTEARRNGVLFGGVFPGRDSPSARFAEMEGTGRPLTLTTEARRNGVLFGGACPVETLLRADSQKWRTREDR